MSSQKSQKGDLLAICRLEFYRKQKNWKLSSQKRVQESKKKVKTTNSKLNQTYSIEPSKEEPPKPEAPRKEKQPNLDEAFVETETGTVSELDEAAQEEELLINLNNDHNTDTDNKLSPPLDPPNSPYSPKWSIQRWAERHLHWHPESTCPGQDSNCPQPETKLTEDAYYPALDTNCNNYDNQDCYPQSSHSHHKGASYPNINICDDLDYPTHFYYNSKPYIQELHNPKQGASVLYYNSNIQHHRFNVPHHESYMPHHGAEVPSNESNFHHDGSTVPQSGTGLLNVAQPWEWEGHCAGEGPAWTQDWPEGMVGEAGPGGEDHLDGAGADCESPPPGDWLRDDLSKESLPSVTSGEFMRGAALAPHSTQIDLLSVESEPTMLSGTALAQAVKRHSVALRHLLAEARRRQTPVSDPRCSCDEVPVRDPGPAMQHAPLFFNDPFVAGSYRTKPDLRGHTEVSRGRLIKIDMGRPYRL